MARNIYGLGDYSTNQIREMATGVERAGLDPAPMYLRRPDAAEEPNTTIRTMSLRDVPFIIPDAFAGAAGPGLAMSLSLPQLEAIGAEGDVYLKGAIKIALDAAVALNPTDEHLKELTRYVSMSPAWQV